MKRAPIALLAASFVWGLSVPLATAVLHHLTAADLVLVENVSGTLIVGTAALVTGRKLRGPWRPSIALGSLEPGLAYVLVNLGLQRTTAAAGAMLLALESVFIAALGWLVPVRAGALSRSRRPRTRTDRRTPCRAQRDRRIGLAQWQRPRRPRLDRRGRLRRRRAPPRCRAGARGSRVPPGRRRRSC